MMPTGTFCFVTQSQKPADGDWENYW